MLLLQSFTTRGSHVASLVKFPPLVKEEIVCQMDNRQTDGGIHNIPMAFFFFFFLGGGGGVEGDKYDIYVLVQRETS